MLAVLFIQELVGQLTAKLEARPEPVAGKELVAVGEVVFVQELVVRGLTAELIATPAEAINMHNTFSCMMQTN